MARADLSVKWKTLTANSKFENAVASLKAGIRAGLDGAAADFAALTGARQYAAFNA